MYNTENQNEKRKYAIQIINHVTDASFLRLLEAVLESGPQLTLLIYIFTQTQKSGFVITETVIVQLVSMGVSLLSMTTAVSMYQRSLRRSLRSRNEFNCCNSMLVTIATGSEVTARVMALGLFASAVSNVTFSFTLFLHYGIVTFWIFRMNTRFFNNQSEELSGNGLSVFLQQQIRRHGEKWFKALFGVIFIFCYLNPEDTPTLQRSISFYMGMFAENILFMMTWYSSTPAVSEKFPVLIMHIICFLFSIILRFIYYNYFHPTIGKLSNRSVLENDDTEIVVVGGEIISKTNHNKVILEESHKNGDASMPLRENFKSVEAENKMQNGDAGVALTEGNKIVEAEINMQNGDAGVALKEGNKIVEAEINMQNGDAGVALIEIGKTVEAENNSDAGVALIENGMSVEAENQMQNGDTGVPLKEHGKSVEAENSVDAGIALKENGISVETENKIQKGDAGVPLKENGEGVAADNNMQNSDANVSLKESNKSVEAENKMQNGNGVALIENVKFVEVKNNGDAGAPLKKNGKSGEAENKMQNGDTGVPLKENVKFVEAENKMQNGDTGVPLKENVKFVEDENNADAGVPLKENGKSGEAENKMQNGDTGVPSKGNVKFVEAENKMQNDDAGRPL